MTKEGTRKGAQTIPEKLSPANDDFDPLEENGNGTGTGTLIPTCAEDLIQIILQSKNFLQCIYYMLILFSSNRFRKSRNKNEEEISK